MNYFKDHEILSPDGLLQLEEGNFLIQDHALKKLNLVRECIDEPVFINHKGLKLRGYRSYKENSAIEKSAQFSRHMQGIAFDCTIASGRYVQLIWHALMAGAGAIGWYPDNNFLHIDFRVNKNHTVTCWGANIPSFSIKISEFEHENIDLFIKVLMDKFRMSGLQI